MGEKFPLTVAAKQKIVYLDPTPKPQLVEWGNRYRDAGLFHDALEFYTKAGDESGLRALLETAVDEADLVLLLNTCNALGSPSPPERIRALKERADAIGKAAVAERAGLLLVSSK